MKLGIVSDLHCNIDGLDRALATMGPIDALLCLGDSIYEYSFSNAVIGRLRELDALTILGNHEGVFLGFVGVSFVASWILAVLSWNLFEKRILALKRYFSYDSAADAPEQAAAGARSAVNMPRG